MATRTFELPDFVKERQAQAASDTPPAITTRRREVPIIYQSYEAEEAWWARVFAERGIDDTLESEK